MKKFLLCLLCLCIVFSTVGCAGGGTSSGDAVGTVGKDSKNDNFPLTKEKGILAKNNIPYVQTTDLEGAIGELDILYMTRVQRERFFNEEDYLRLKDSYILTPDKLKGAKDDLSILHPLPRVNEISVAVDNDKRACYFKQALYGKYMRMALILKLLEIE